MTYDLTHGLLKFIKHWRPEAYRTLVELDIRSYEMDGSLPGGSRCLLTFPGVERGLDGFERSVDYRTGTLVFCGTPALLETHQAPDNAVRIESLSEGETCWVDAVLLGHNLRLDLGTSRHTLAKVVSCQGYMRRLEIHGYACSIDLAELQTWEGLAWQEPVTS